MNRQITIAIVLVLTFSVAVVATTFATEAQAAASHSSDGTAGLAIAGSHFSGSQASKTASDAVQLNGVCFVTATCI
jgi:hypothetical protein